MGRSFAGYLILLLAGTAALAWIGADPAPAPQEAALAAEGPGPAAAAAPPGSAAAILAGGPAGTAPAEDLRATTAAILAGLGHPVAAPPGTDPELAAMSQAALTALAARGSARPTLAAIVTRALREGQSDAHIDALVNEAVGRGTVAAPAGLTTPEGRVDTAAMLAHLVAQAQGADLGEGDRGDPGTPDLPLTAGPEGRDALHLVGPGDSLGGIALRYWGDASLYPLLFAANRGALASPDRLRVGQRLTVPARPGL